MFIISFSISSALLFPLLIYYAIKFLSFVDKQEAKPTRDLGRSGELIITDPPKIETTIDTTQVERRDLSKSGSSMAISEDEDSTKQEIALQTTIEEPKTGTFF